MKKMSGISKIIRLKRTKKDKSN